MCQCYCLSRYRCTNCRGCTSIFFTMAKLGGIQFHGSKNEDGSYDSDTLSFSFKSPVLKHFLKEWADKKAIIDHLRDEAIKSPDDQVKEYLLHRADEIEQELELRMVDSQLIINQTKK